MTKSHTSTRPDRTSLLNHSASAGNRRSRAQVQIAVSTRAGRESAAGWGMLVRARLATTLAARFDLAGSAVDVSSHIEVGERRAARYFA